MVTHNITLEHDELLIRIKINALLLATHLRKSKSWEHYSFQLISIVMSFICPNCEKPFTRMYNLKRHLESQHKSAMEDEDIIAMGGNDTDDEKDDDVNDDVVEEGAAEDDDTDEDGDTDEDDDTDDDNKTIWQLFRDKAVSTLEEEEGEEDVGEDDPEKQDAVADGKESGNMTLMTVDKISEYYVSFLRLQNLLKRDPTHKKITITKKRLIEEEEYSEIEAVMQAAKQRKLAIAEASGINIKSPIDMTFM